MKQYEKVCTSMKIFENYILLHTSMYWYDGYHGISRYMAVYHGIWWYEIIETSTYKFIPVYHCIWLFQDCIKPTYWYMLAWHTKGHSQKVTLRVIEKKNLRAKHCILSARWDYKQHRFKDFFFRQHRFRNATLEGISNTRSKERSEAL